MRGYLEAFHHYCEVEDWEAAKAVLLDQRSDQLEVWGYYRELLPLYERVLGKLDASFNAICAIAIGGIYYVLGDYPQSINYYQQGLEIARSSYPLLIKMAECNSSGR
jgi:tetratricopeptide (TPR) repeat protein